MKNKIHLITPAKQTTNLILFWKKLLEIAVVAYEPDQKLQEQKRKVLNEETIPFYLTKLEEIAKANNGHLALKRMTWADVFLTGNLKKFMAHFWLIIEFILL